MTRFRKMGTYGALWLALAAPLFAADPAAQPNFVTGGVGDEELASLNAVKPQYNVRLLLTQKDGAYIAGVPVTIVDRKGATVLEAESKGPHLFVQLPDGSYRISATYEGKTLARSVSVKGNAARNVHFAW
ncbi:carboxypeptidase regulatory-like domain-containing protein [Chitiniphilus eburneus]|uniref:Carboxypeptidase regulatory-like domain-containing protein n=1 Tax=Chitiniphilus eburneus TaxID=2571148 RepID=A0A4U0PLU4_9NEIS|nr:carboxypeptidase regulatory-like domain-containing protein [Chitiniphilus eburneus]TJZ69009.1 carboxypeptidase regulatory-like domain-containing protein [Chitiniphilus eburneus]